jgi:hypothetical protein
LLQVGNEVFDVGSLDLRPDVVFIEAGKRTPMISSLVVFAVGCSGMVRSIH